MTYPAATLGASATRMPARSRGTLRSDAAFQQKSARYRAVELISGSNAIPRRARRGLAGLRRHRHPTPLRDIHAPRRRPRGPAHRCAAPDLVANPGTGAAYPPTALLTVGP